MSVRVHPLAMLLVGALVLSLPLLAHAVGKAPCACQMDPKLPLFCPTVVCVDNTNGFPTVGHCVAPTVCHGETGGGKGLDATLSQLGKMLGDLLGKLGQGGGGGGGGSPPGVPPNSGTGCTTGQYFQTSDITQLSNPCAQYAPPPAPLSPVVGTSSCDTLSQLLGTCGAPSATDTTTSTNLNSNINQNQNQSTVTGVLSTTGTGIPNLGAPSFLAPAPSGGVSGDIVFSGNGATIFGVSQNPANNTGVAGFFGGDTFNSQQPQGLAAQFCRGRPWANSFFASILPTAFFDGLCTAHGYAVGAQLPIAPVVELQQTVPASKPKKTLPASASTTPSVPARVQMWAVPASVPLATRTSIFWNTQGVTDCTETSPDGSFNEHSLSGGAATVPLTGATTFTISCLDSNGNAVTGYVTVNLSI